MANQELTVLPRPKELLWGQGAFCLDADTRIALLPSAPADATLAAQLLQQEIAARCGWLLPIVKTAEPLAGKLIMLVHDPHEAERLALGGLPWDASLATRGEQAVALAIGPQRVVAGGQSLAALFYGAQTLRQIVRTAGPCWPALTLRDWPALPNRGIMMDVCRGKVPTLDTLKWVVDEMSLYRLNVLQLYTEHTFAFAHHPRIGQDCGSLTPEDMLALDAYARQRQVELIPNLNSFGHCEHLLGLPEYAHLAESDIARWSLCPVDEDTFQLLDELYGDMLPSFSSAWFNIGCDETWDLGKGRSAGAVATKGIGRVYLEYLLRLRELAARHGKRVQIWGDILLHHPELVPELPEDVILLDWHYEAADTYPSLEVFASSGRTFWVCPGTSSWNTLFPRVENANGNIRNLVAGGVAAGATGVLNTDWGDHGHYQPIGQSLYGYLYGAEQGWTGGTTEDGDFDARFGRLVFGVAGAQVVTAVRNLGRLNVLPGMARPNAANTIYALLDEPLVGPMLDALPAETLNAVVTGCQSAVRDLRGALSTSLDPISVDEMAFSAELIGYAARKVRACQALRTALSGLTASNVETVLSDGIATLRALDGELMTLAERFRAVWLRRARQAEMSITLEHFAGVRERLLLAQAWLGQQRAAARAGASPSCDLEAYREWAGEYYILGQRLWQRLEAAGAA